MKKTILCLLLLCITVSGYPLTLSDSIQKQTKVTVITDDGKPSNTAVAISTPCPDCKNETGINPRFLVWMPVILFLTLFLIVVWAARRSGYNFSQAFYAEDPEEITISAATAADPNATITKTLLDKDGNPVFYPSSSRLIAFLSAMTTLIIVVSFISYYAYCMVRCKELPKFEELFNVILALGLGIVPYGVNKITSEGKQS